MSRLAGQSGRQEHIGEDVMSAINSAPPHMDNPTGAAKVTSTDCFVTYLTSNPNILVQLTYPGTWSVSPAGPVNGYNATVTTIMGITNITFDFTAADYTETAVFTFTDTDSNTYYVTMSGPPLE
jgi:hypothetical protein